jgi:hypothetical protein
MNPAVVRMEYYVNNDWRVTVYFGGDFNACSEYWVESFLMIFNPLEPNGSYMYQPL